MSHYLTRVLAWARSAAAAFGDDKAPENLVSNILMIFPSRWTFTATFERNLSEGIHSHRLITHVPSWSLMTELKRQIGRLLALALGTKPKSDTALPSRLASFSVLKISLRNFIFIFTIQYVVCSRQDSQKVNFPECQSIPCKESAQLSEVHSTIPIEAKDLNTTPLPPTLILRGNGFFHVEKFSGAFRSGTSCRDAVSGLDEGLGVRCVAAFCCLSLAEC